MNPTESFSRIQQGLQTRMLTNEEVSQVNGILDRAIAGDTKDFQKVLGRVYSMAGKNKEVYTRMVSEAIDVGGRGRW